MVLFAKLPGQKVTNVDVNESLEMGELFFPGNERTAALSDGECFESEPASLAKYGNSQLRHLCDICPGCAERERKVFYAGASK